MVYVIIHTFFILSIHFSQSSLPSGFYKRIIFFFFQFCLYGKIFMLDCYKSEKEINCTAKQRSHQEQVAEDMKRWKAENDG